MGQKKMTLEEKKIRRRTLTELNIPDFVDFLAQQVSGPAFRSAQPLAPQYQPRLFCRSLCWVFSSRSSPSNPPTRNLPDPSVASHRRTCPLPAIRRKSFS